LGEESPGTLFPIFAIGSLKPSAADEARLGFLTVDDRDQEGEERPYFSNGEDSVTSTWVESPMWLVVMQDACVFPIGYAVGRRSIGCALETSA
jgi:hypothetical protein